MTAADHGSASTYVNYKCRCAKCTGAWADQIQKRKLRRKAWVAAHGVEYVPRRTVSVSGAFMSSADEARRIADQGATLRNDLLAAFVADVVTDCINGGDGPMDWTRTTAALQAEEDAADPFDHYAEMRDEARHDDA